MSDRALVIGVLITVAVLGIGLACVSDPRVLAAAAWVFGAVALFVVGAGIAADLRRWWQRRNR